MKTVLLSAPLLAAAVIACIGDSAPTPLRATPPGNGPEIVFDLVARPLPNIPLPNDVATFPDPTSRTGLRLNASLVASTNMERVTRVGFDQMEGWGTYAPMTVAFSKPAGADPLDPALDLGNVKARASDEYDFSNDAFYLINLTTGLPVPLDVGNGNYPATVSDPTSYYPNDVKLTQGVQNILFDTIEEGAGLSQADYRPWLDQDMDGVLDHPNTLGGGGRHPGIDNLLTWYERETDTLILRPILPLEEKTEYAVILTDRLTDPRGQPVRSPFDQVYHATQSDGAAKVQNVIDDPRHTAYFGDIAGSGLDHVAFLWTFTTQPTQEDMRLLRDGLYGKGPFASFADNYPTKVTLYQAAGTSADPSKEKPGWEDSASCKNVKPHPYMVRIGDIATTLNLFFTQLFGYSGATDTLLQSEVSNIDHMVIGTFDSPYLMGDPASPNPDSQFNLDFVSGQGPVTTDKVHFYILVPKETAEFHQPFPVTFWEHGVTGHDDEVFIYGGNFAKQGIATIGIDMPEHGLYIPDDQKTFAGDLLAGDCIAPYVNAIATGRDHDLNYDGIPDSGGLWWTAHVFHTRDNVRQGTLDMMNAVRILRSFDGKEKAGQDYNNDGNAGNDVAGDFDNDGVPDVGGPNVKYYGAGESLGGLMGEIIGGIDPYVSATGPVSGGGGGALDISTRSYGVAGAVVLQLLSPLVLGMPSSDRPPSSGTNQTNCGPTQRTVRFYVNDLTGSQELEVACVEAKDLGPNMTVVITNFTSGDIRCGRTLDQDGRFRVPIPASIGDAIDIQIYPEADVVDSYKTCNVPTSAKTGRHITTWEQPAITYAPESDPTITCPGQSKGEPNKCQQFLNQFYPVGSPLVAPQEGLGYQRNTPDFRRLVDLVQAAFDPADPINYAPYYMMRPNIGPDGTALPPRGLLGVSTVGDGYVNISSGIAFARAAGALPFFPPTAIASYPDFGDYVTPATLYTAWGGMTANEVLVSGYEVEGISRLARTPADPSCNVNYVMPPTSQCNAPPALDPTSCTDALFDADWYAEGLDQYGQQHPAVPLRAARDTTVHPRNAASLAAAWKSRIDGAPLPLTSGLPPGPFPPSPHPLLAAVELYLQPTGQHVYDAGQPCDAFDAPSYMDNTMARYFATGGTDLYYLTHPATHRCMADRTCPFLQ